MNFKRGFSLGKRNGISLGWKIRMVGRTCEAKEMLCKCMMRQTSKLQAYGVRVDVKEAVSGHCCGKSVSSCRIHDAVPRFRDLDENRPGCTCVRSLEKRPIRFAILDQRIVLEIDPIFSAYIYIYVYRTSSFLFSFFKFQSSKNLNILFKNYLSLSLSL